MLTPEERAVYLAMDPRDREHAVRVTQRVWRHCPDAPAELLAGALLHDCGKSARRYRVWERVLAGLVPQRYSACLPWEPLQIRAWHPQLGARMLRAAGGRERVAQLVERHHTPGGDAHAAVLHRYDDLE
ncbi:HD domain-containing protein [Deinococcus peraridilitoris]|uniref:HD domain-containing protein n=1 Tax=Deinococcus peraridilitoris TaxID=432329 RepID=UPI00316AC19C